MHIILIYLGIIVGIFLEGEIIMISSVIAAHNGYLNIWLVLLLGFLGTLVSDNFYFALGRKKGKKWLHKNQRLLKKVDIVEYQLNKHAVLIFIGYRFLYGFRAITPLVIGVSNIKTSKFVIYSILSTSIWTVTYGTLGYLFGEIVKKYLGHIENIEKYFFAGVITIALAILVIQIRRRKKEFNQPY